MRTILVSSLYLLLVTASCLAEKVLILGPTVGGGLGSPEAEIARGLGYTVDVVDAVTWGKMKQSDFASYRAIILGDPFCGSLDLLTAASANTGTWGPAVNGNIIIIGTDPQVHPPGGPILTANGIRFALEQPGKTGLYVTLSCYYWNAPATAVPALSYFGTFVVMPVGCYNQCHIVATSPTMENLSDGVLSDWSCSVHEAFSLWPASFLPVAIAEDVGTVFTAPDLSVGSPYILARGPSLMQPANRISLTPYRAVNPTNSQHTICARVVDLGAPLMGATVTFNVISGPNAGFTTQAVTDGNGKACFTYVGTGGVGTDTISASAVNAQGAPLSAAPNAVTKTWFDPCGMTPLAARVDEVTCGSSVVRVRFNEYVTAASALNLGNYVFDNGLYAIDASFAPGSKSEVVVTVSHYFVSFTTYTLQIFNVENLCGRVLDPNPAVLTFGCAVPCPTVKCSSNLVVQCTGPAGTKVNYDLFTSVTCTNILIYGEPPSGSLFPPGVTTVTGYAVAPGSTDPPTNICTFTVTVTDLIPPVVQCPADIVIHTGCAAVAVPFTVNVTDNCCTNPTLVCTPPSGSLFSVGTTPVHCVATDCSVNTNSCDFTIEVIYNANSSPPVITRYPTNIYLCGTNGCAILPNLTGQVEVAGGGDTLYVSQSIPALTTVCSNPIVTFIVTNACGDMAEQQAHVLTGPCGCDRLAFAAWPSPLTNIAVWEGSGEGTVHHFPIIPFDPRLLPIPNGPTVANNDFSADGGKYYDVYLSDADGKPDTNGCCITVLCRQTLALLNYDSGGNVDAVELNFIDGTVRGASRLGNVKLGQGLTDPTLFYSPGFADRALGLHDGNTSYLGYGTNRLTVCYEVPSAVKVAIGRASNSSDTLLNLHWDDHFVRPWQLFRSTNLLDWTFSGVTSSPAILTNLPSAQFFQLRFNAKTN